MTETIGETILEIRQKEKGKKEKKKVLHFCQVCGAEEALPGEKYGKGCEERAY